MQQGDQTVLSLRPGGGRGSSNRLFGASSSSSSSAAPPSLAFGSFSDLPILRPHGAAPASAFPLTVYSRMYPCLFVWIWMNFWAILVLCQWVFVFGFDDKDWVFG